jgi:hypothetical protein
MRGTPEFEKRFEELVTEFEDDPEQLTLLLRAQKCIHETELDPHRWPLFDLRDHIASYRAVIGVCRLKGVDFQYVLFYEKHSGDDGTRRPFWIWADRVDVNP